MENGIRAATLRFPLKALEIRRIALANVDFRSLCEDLADAEAAFDRCASSADANSDKRRSEYQILKEELAIEIETALAALSPHQRGE
jgi:DNA-directed RNA polymerase specialized sigma24 family protein